MSTQLQVFAHVAASPLRCPYCHGDVSTRFDDWVACRECLARHHVSCWRELLACASCGRQEFVSSAPRARPSVLPPRSVRQERLGLITLGVYIGSALGLIPAALLTMLVAAIFNHLEALQMILGCTVFCAGMFGSGYLGARVAHRMTR